MADVIAPLKTVTFTVTRVPPRSAQRKTIERLMKMQPDVQHGLKMRARKRRQHDNIVDIRAGRKWIQRVTASKLARAEEGQTFTLTLTPQIIPDVKSVQQFLKAAKAK
ncbi:MAG: hypothetical protein ACYTEI_15520 [Planctomycetota bacterium]|jgi:hypothetical protein